MEYEVVMAIIADGGGFDNVIRLVFDNAIHINFTQRPQEGKLKASDFIQLGGGWVYKEKSFIRSNDTYEYDVPIINYHPFDCMQSIIMSTDANRVDVFSVNDMMSGN